VFPIIGGLLCIYLMTKLEAVTWLRFFAWLAIGLVIYFAYGRTHSRLQRGDVDGDGPRFSRDPTAGGPAQPAPTTRPEA
jgi:basic amino acid/polyamine antiporter, APA family